MKKINPKVISLAVLLLGLLIGGTVAIQEVRGDPTVEPGPIGYDGQ